MELTFWKCAAWKSYILFLLLSKNLLHIMHSFSKIRADYKVNVTGIYCTTTLQKYDFKAINSNELFYVSTLRNFYLLATRVKLQCSLSVETDFVT